MDTSCYYYYYHCYYFKMTNAAKSLLQTRGLALSWRYVRESSITKQEAAGLIWNTVCPAVTSLAKGQGCFRSGAGAHVAGCTRIPLGQLQSCGSLASFPAQWNQTPWGWGPGIRVCKSFPSGPNSKARTENCWLLGSHMCYLQSSGIMVNNRKEKLFN